MSTLDLDKRKVFSLLERKAKVFEDEGQKTSIEIKLSLLNDFYQEEDKVDNFIKRNFEFDPYINKIPLLKNEEYLGEILLTIEEQTNRRFVYKNGYERKLVFETVNDNADEVNNFVKGDFHVEKYDLVYSVVFNPKISAIDPKDFLDRSEFQYITKDGPNYYFENSLIELDERALYYKVFDILFSLTDGDGGLALYKDLILGAKKIDKKRKGQPDNKLIKFIQDNLTGNQNGFIKKAKLPSPMPNGKELIKVVHSIGIDFNNKK